MDRTPFENGLADAWDRGYGASRPHPDDTGEYQQGYNEGTKQVAAYRAKHASPFNVAIDAAGAIQHAVTVTRPDPRRAEMATRIYIQVLDRIDQRAMAGHGQYTPGWATAAANEAVDLTDALLAALARKEKQ